MVDYRAAPVHLPNYSISTMMFVQADLAVVTLIDDDRIVESNDMIGLIKIHQSSNKFCFLDTRAIDLRANKRGGQFKEYSEIFQVSFLRQILSKLLWNQLYLIKFVVQRKKSEHA